MDVWIDGCHPGVDRICVLKRGLAFDPIERCWAMFAYMRMDRNIYAGVCHAYMCLRV